MMKNDDQYFQHDYRARNNLKIKALLKKHGAAAYAVYWAIVEELHQKGNQFKLKTWFIDGIASDLYLEPIQINDIINSCVDYELFTIENDIISCNRVQENIDKREQIKEQKRQAGIRSAQARAEHTYVEQQLTAVQQPLTPVEHEPTKESKENKIKKKRKETPQSVGHPYDPFYQKFQLITEQLGTPNLSYTPKRQRIFQLAINTFSMQGITTAIQNMQNNPNAPPKEKEFDGFFNQWDWQEIIDKYLNNGQATQVISIKV